VGVERLIGVYRADGGVRGELRYLIGHYLRGESCSLCDITHSPFRRKAEWDEQVRVLGVPFDLLHLNELDAGLAAFIGDRAACIVAESQDGFTLILGNDELMQLEGSVDGFFALLRARLADGRSAESRPSND
jgi:hypothetical protein